MDDLSCSALAWWVYQKKSSCFNIWVPSLVIKYQNILYSHTYWWLISMGLKNIQSEPKKHGILSWRTERRLPKYWIGKFAVCICASFCRHFVNLWFYPILLISNCSNLFFYDIKSAVYRAYSYAFLTFVL